MLSKNIYSARKYCLIIVLPTISYLLTVWVLVLSLQVFHVAFFTSWLLLSEVGAQQPDMPHAINEKLVYTQSHTHLLQTTVVVLESTLTATQPGGQPHNMVFYPNVHKRAYEGQQNKSQMMVESQIISIHMPITAPSVNNTKLCPILTHLKLMFVKWKLGSGVL